ncbi:PfkB family carbohydrate kinase [Mangrovibacter plantisponsor]|uniref:Fructoselysine 6-kinase n=1 Tax=Mangrovibacter plantisponsor TaxID=451513 RepID=A0A317PJS7_9ENTR|nr:PfkB family carbohydrate kinase [Mangrovibacter plantisponsor]PWW01292.1 fructoselysine 6-kinase [Mangrovibacter plantisponsor]
MKVLGLGDNVIDRYQHTGLGYPGGNALNFSVFAHELYADTAYLGIFGDDAAAAHIRQILANRQIQTRHCLDVPGESGFATLTIQNGDRVFLGSNAGGVRQRTPMDFILQHQPWLSEFSLIHSAAYSYTEHLLPQLARLPGLLSYDFSDDFTPDNALACCQWLDYAFFSCSERSLSETRELLAEAHHKGGAITVATRGEEGALLFDGETWLFQHPTPITAVDTLGAGDGFITAFLLAHLSGKNLVTSLQAGADFAAQVCTTDGAFGEPIQLALL